MIWYEIVMQNEPFDAQLVVLLIKVTEYIMLYLKINYILYQKDANLLVWAVQVLAFISSSQAGHSC